MQDKISRKLFLGFINIHILHHAQKDRVYGAFMIEELKRHGYNISAGTLYPILHSLEKEGYLTVEYEVVSGKQRKYYSTTEKGDIALDEVRKKAKELTNEIL